MPSGVHMRVRNAIPLTRGFGSSAAATAAGIAIGMWIRNGTPPERQQVLDAATRVEGHPDNISAAILGGLTVSAVVDDEVIANSLRIPYGLEIVVIIPDREISTRKAREALPLSIPRAEAVFNLQRLGLLLSGLFLNRKHLLVHGVQDRIHQNRRFPILPSMGAAVSALNDRRACLGAFVSGAGPAIAAFTRGRRSAARRARRLDLSRVGHRRGVQGARTGLPRDDLLGVERHGRFVPPCSDRRREVRRDVCRDGRPHTWCRAARRRDEETGASGRGRRFGHGQVDRRARATLARDQSTTSAAGARHAAPRRRDRERVASRDGDRSGGRARDFVHRVASRHDHGLVPHAGAHSKGAR